MCVRTYLDLDHMISIYVTLGKRTFTYFNPGYLFKTVHGMEVLDHYVRMHREEGEGV